MTSKIAVHAAEEMVSRPRAPAGREGRGAVPGRGPGFSLDAMSQSAHLVNRSLTRAWQAGPGVPVEAIENCVSRAARVACNAMRTGQMAANRRNRGMAQARSGAGAAEAPQELFRAAQAHHQSGRVEEAEATYRRVLALDPEHGDALHLLGLIALQRGRAHEAAELIGKAARVEPGSPIYHCNLGIALHALGQLEAAVAAFRRALEIRPDYAVALGNLVAGLKLLGGLDEALGACRRLRDLRPGDPEVHANLGELLRDAGEPEAALEAVQRALDLGPEQAAAHNLLGSVLLELDQVAAAEAAFRRAIALAPEFAPPHANLCEALRQQDRLEEAEAAGRRALEIDPDYATAHWNRAYALLGLGRLAEGWREYEHRLRIKAHHRPVPCPRWQGGPLDGRTILVLAEQGVGDEIQFASCLPDLVARSGHCIIQCDPRLEPLFARSFPSATVRGAAREEADWLAGLPPIDAHLPLASLLGHFRPSIESFAGKGGYLAPDPERRERFAEQLAALGPGLTVGLSWRSMRQRLRQRSRRRHYAALEDWSELLAVEGVRFVNLQYDKAGPELAEAEARFGARIHQLPGLDLLDDFDGVAALIAALDLVIAPNNTVHGLAGALNARLWTFHLPSSWGILGTDGYPWFPSARMYRLAADAPDWSPVIARMADDLKRLLRDRQARPRGR